MGRPREFDLDQALETAMETFWRRGYEATSLCDLLEAMELHKGSLYQAFGDKRSLYLAALERYQFRIRERLAETFNEAASAKEGIRAWFLRAASRSACKEGSKGCFVVNTIVELTPHDNEVRNLTLSHANTVEDMFKQAVEKGQREGDFRADLDPKIAARYLMCSGFGLFVAGKSLQAPVPPEKLVALVLTALE